VSACRQIVFNGVILSTDEYFVSVEGVYQHDSRLLQQAHYWNQQRGLTHTSSQLTHLINLFSGIHEIPQDRVVVLKTISLGSLRHCRLAEKLLSCGG